MIATRERKARMTERALQAELVDLLGRFGWLTYHTFDSRRSAPGFPDLVAIKGGRLLAIECKSNLGRATPDQTRWLAAFADVAGCEAYIIRPADDLGELVAIL